MANAERPSKELVPTGLDGEQCAQFNDLVQNAADHLELHGVLPDETTYEVSNIAFGRSGEEKLTLSHTNDNGFHSGLIYYSHRAGLDAFDNQRQSFVLKNTISDGTLWRLGQRVASSNVVLHKLQRNWPIGTNRDTLDALIEKIAATDQDSIADSVPSEVILKLLEDYALEQNSGDVEYEKRWDYHDLVLDPESGITRIQSASLTIFSDDDGFTRQVTVNADVSPRDINGAQTPLILHINSDELGNTTITNTYKNPITGKLTNQPIKNYGARYSEAKRLIDSLVAEKTGSTS